MWVIPWDLLLRWPWRLGFAPVRARCGGGAASWDSGVLAAPGTQGGWWPGQQEIECSRRVWKPVLANTLQYSCLESPPIRKPGRAQSTRSQRIGHNWSDPVKKAMAPHSSTLAWKMPWMEDPGRLQSMGSLRVGHDWATSLSLFTFMHWRRKWQPTPVFLPGESQGRWSLVGCHLWGCTELDTTEVT